MRKKLTALALSGVMLCSAGIPALAAPIPVDRSGAKTPEPAPWPTASCTTAR